jgi:hypothetical protein
VRAAKRDDAEEPIVEALLKVGAYVVRLDQPCDLLVQFRNRWFTLEVKTGNRGTRKCQTAQREFLELTNTPVVRTPLDALSAIGAVIPSRRDSSIDVRLSPPGRPQS